MRQHEAVAVAMRDLGGYATFGKLYRAVLAVPGCHWGTKTPFASIRRIVQERPDLFFRVKPGLWGLEAERDRIEAELGIGAGQTSGAAAEADHAYYQGLLLELGNFKGFETFVPYQDKNRRFLDRKLGDVATLSQFHPFTYDHLIRRAVTIDVTWFNSRKLPARFLEVERTTDYQNSLLKFHDLRDFRAEFVIVADAVRKAEYESKMLYSAFESIRGIVRFWNFEQVAALHEKMAAAAIAEAAII